MGPTRCRARTRETKTGACPSANSNFFTLRDAHARRWARVVGVRCGPPYAAAPRLPFAVEHDDLDGVGVGQDLELGEPLARVLFGADVHRGVHHVYDDDLGLLSPQRADLRGPQADGGGIHSSVQIFEVFVSATAPSCIRQ